MTTGDEEAAEDAMIAMTEEEISTGGTAEIAETGTTVIQEEEDLETDHPRQTAETIHKE